MTLCVKCQMVNATAFTSSLISWWTFAVRHAMMICLEDTFGDRNKATMASVASVLMATLVAVMAATMEAMPSSTITISVASTH